MKMKKRIKNFARKFAKYPLIKEFINEEKKVARRTIGRAAKDAKSKIKTK